MVSALSIALIAIPLYWVYSNISALQRNIAAAKRSGLPFIVTPFNIYNALWMSTATLWLPLLHRLPENWTSSWLELLHPDWVWDNPRSPWEKYGDTFLTVSPGLVIAWVSNAEAVRQITSRRETFPKPLESYKLLDIFGRNIVTTEGAEWKQHRKITSRDFNEANNELVFAESCSQTEGLLKRWTDIMPGSSKTIKDVPTDTMRLTLHIISSIGFGIKLLWPGEQSSESQTEKESFSSNKPPPGHTMSFEGALSTLLERLLLVLLAPNWILKRLPFKASQEASESFSNWTQYMNELLSRKKQEARGQQRTGGMDIMGSLVNSAYGEEPNLSRLSGSPSSRAEKERGGIPVLSDSDILGNAFVMIIAGHETTANSVHFSLIELAINAKAQREVQKEVHSIFGDTAPKDWAYESSINQLLGGIVGAVLNEQLRLMPPIVAIPKSVPKSRDETISIDGKKITLPAGAHIGLCTIAAHRSVRYWPTKPSKISNRLDDLDDFMPERWLIKIGADGKKQLDSGALQSEADEGFVGSFTGNDSHAKLFHPVRGSYFPFSEGARSCLGRRLAQVEVMAVLAVVFQKFSIELAVDEWASDNEVERMSVEEKRVIYRKAQEKARATMRTATSLITLKLHSGHIPVRLVKKGEERFVNMID